jgi:hypothetical protein
MRGFAFAADDEVSRNGVGAIKMARDAAANGFARLEQTCVPGLNSQGWSFGRCVPVLVLQRLGVAMSIFAYRKHLRFLSQTHRRQWWDQRKRLTPRVRISGAYVPPSVTREFAYVKVG